jgi:hypothetical protein
MSKVKLSVAEIREGDSFISNGAGWRAIEDAETFTNGEVAVRVRFEPDGGIGDRVWDNNSVTLEVER